MADVRKLTIVAIAVAVAVVGLLWIILSPLQIDVTVEHSFPRPDWRLKDAIEGKASLEDIEALLAENPSLQSHTIGGELPLHWAAKAGRADVTAMLLRRGADVNAPVAGDWGARGTTPIMFAVGSGDIDTVTVLVDSGADLSARDRWGSGLVERAEQHGHLEIAAFVGERLIADEQSD